MKIITLLALTGMSVNTAIGHPPDSTKPALSTTYSATDDDYSAHSADTANRVTKRDGIGELTVCNLPDFQLKNTTVTIIGAFKVPGPPDPDSCQTTRDIITDACYQVPAKQVTDCIGSVGPTEGIGCWLYVTSNCDSVESWPVIYPGVNTGIGLPYNSRYAQSFACSPLVGRGIDSRNPTPPIPRDRPLLASTPSSAATAFITESGIAKRDGIGEFTMCNLPKFQLDELPAGGLDSDSCQTVRNIQSGKCYDVPEPQQMGGIQSAGPTKGMECFLLTQAYCQGTASDSFDHPGRDLDTRSWNPYRSAKSFKCIPTGGKKTAFTSNEAGPPTTLIVRDDSTTAPASSSSATASPTKCEEAPDQLYLQYATGPNLTGNRDRLCTLPGQCVGWSQSVSHVWTIWPNQVCHLYLDDEHCRSNEFITAQGSESIIDVEKTFGGKWKTPTHVMCHWANGTEVVDPPPGMPGIPAVTALPPAPEQTKLRQRDNYLDDGFGPGWQQLDLCPLTDWNEDVANSIQCYRSTPRLGQCHSLQQYYDLNDEPDNSYYVAMSSVKIFDEGRFCSFFLKPSCKGKKSKTLYSSNGPTSGARNVSHALGPLYEHAKSVQCDVSKWK